MKNIFIISLFVLFPLLGVNAQQKCNRSEMIAKYMAEKQEYMKQCISLSDEEAEKFFPLYNELEKKKFEASFPVYKKARELRKSSEAISDDKYSEMVAELSSLPQKIATLESEYFEKFKSVLSPKQMFMFFNCEHSFGKAILKKKQNNQNNK